MFGIGFAKPGKSRKINLTGDTYTRISSTNPTTVSFKVDNDGYTYVKYNAGAYSPVNQTTDWFHPVADAPADYQVRYTSATGDTGSLTCTTAEDTWHDIGLSGDWIITISDTVDGGLGKSATFTIEIRKGTGATVASASFTLTADYSTV